MNPRENARTTITIDTPGQKTYYVLVELVLMKQQDPSARRDKCIGRRIFLAGMTAGVVGLGSLHSPSIKDALAQSTSSQTVGWPQYRANSSRSGVVADRHVPTSNVTPKWPLKKQNVGQPVADEDTIYLTSETLTRENPQLQAISRADGSVRWQTGLTDDTLASSRSIPPAVIDGTVYFSNGTRTRAFDAETGTEQWNSPHGGTWLVVSNGRLYLQGANNAFVTLDSSDGSVVWEGLSGVNDKFLTWKHAVADETLYVGLIERSGDAPSEVRALDSTTGDPQWKTTIDTDYPEVAATKQGVIVATNTVLYSLDPASGTVRWQQQGGPLDRGEARYVSTPVIHEDMVYAAVDGTFFAFNIETGTKQWTTDGVSKTTLVGDRLYGLRGSTLVGLDVTTGQQQTEYRYSGDGRIDTFVPLDGMLLARLYRSFDGYREFPIPGWPLLVLSEDESRSTEDDDSDATDEATETQTQTPTSTPSEPTLHIRTETATQTTPTSTRTDPHTQTTTSSQTTSTLTQSTSTEAATTTASTERTPSAENPTTTDGPGFGVLSTLAAAGVGLWGYRRRE